MWNVWRVNMQLRYSLWCYGHHLLRSEELEYFWNYVKKVSGNGLNHHEAWTERLGILIRAFLAARLLADYFNVSTSDCYSTTKYRPFICLEYSTTDINYLNQGQGIYKILLESHASWANIRKRLLPAVNRESACTIFLSLLSIAISTGVSPSLV